MPAKVNIQAIVTFLLISFTLAWLLTLLLANSDWLHNPWFAPLMCLMVCSPGIAALTTMGIVEKRYVTHIRQLRALGFLGWASPLKFLACLIIAPVSFMVFVFGSLYLAVTFGLLDVTASALTSALKSALASTYSPYGWLPYLILAVGSELGWRGWLLPNLLPLGRYYLGVKLFAADLFGLSLPWDFHGGVACCHLRHGDCGGGCAGVAATI